jgi:transcriptional regulator with XRE-family HTH domain
MVQIIYERLGANIRKRRSALGMTQNSLAKLVGLSRTSVTNVERGRQQMLVHQLIDFAKALQVDLSEFTAALVPAGKTQTSAIADVPPEIQRLMARLSKSPTRRKKS